ncbi:E3 ubiquitin-protein ligase MIB2-like protein, partial [Leptotrombidium deliense]
MDSASESLLYLSETDEVDLVQRLISDNVDINSKDEDGNSAIHRAVKENKVDVLKLLLENEANINAINKEGNTALHVAILNSSIACFQLLIDHKIEINCFNNRKESELMCAMRLRLNGPLKHVRQQMIELLINHEDIDLRGKSDKSKSMLDGSNYLFIAIQFGNIFAVEKILEKDVKL